MAATLTAAGIVHRFGRRTVLDGVELRVPPGRVVGLLGPNGAGKTTLLRILFGVLTPDEGAVAYGDRPATDADRRTWGYMPQERGLYRDMHVRDHLVWLARLHGIARAEGVERADELLDQLGIADRADDEIKDLSGGTAQRVQLAAAMVHDPPVLVLDEPFAGLDPKAVEFLSAVVTDHAAAGGNVLFSSHQLDLVEDLCESITMIDGGRVVMDGEVRALKARSTERYLRVDLTVPEGTVIAGATVTDRNAAGTRMRLQPGADPLRVLDEVRELGPITDFGVTTPSLSELFLAATRPVPA